MNVLLISHNFPPLNRIASNRPYGWVRALVDAGDTVTVLTSRKTARHGDLSLEYDSAGFETLEIAAPEPFRFFACRAIWTLRGAIRLLRTASRRRFDVVISTHGPSPSHLLGFWAARLHRGSAWVADYRDLWTGGRYGRRSRALPRVLARWIERRILRRASLITTVSTGLSRALGAIAPGVPVQVIYNGFDLAPRAPEPRKAADGAPLVLSHTGTVYRGMRDPSPLFRALKTMLDRGLDASRIRVCFAGPDLGAVTEVARDLGVAASVSIEGLLPRREALRLQDRSDLLLLLEDGRAAREGVLTGKLFEYLASGKPILAIGPDGSSEIAAVLAETGAGTCVGTDVDRIADVLTGALRGETGGFYAPDLEAIARYSRERQARAFVKLLGTLRPGGGDARGSSPRRSAR
jgi:glycosyltransferase involved in cell wall biosynthesis